MLFVHEARRYLGGPAIALDDLFDRFIADGADNQRRTRLVDQNAVGLVHQREMRAALHRLLAARIETGGRYVAEQASLRNAHSPQQQAVAQKVEAELLGRAIGDVQAVSFESLGVLV